jgi:hypothetical protein
MNFTNTDCVEVRDAHIFLRWLFKFSVKEEIWWRLLPDQVTNPIFNQIFPIIDKIRKRSNKK